MAKDEASERVILQLRAVLRGISPLIWRRLGRRQLLLPAVIIVAGQTPAGSERHQYRATSRGIAGRFRLGRYAPAPF